MIRGLLTLCFLGLLAVSTGRAAAQAPTPAPAAAIDPFVAAIGAHGGTAALAAVQKIRLTGTATRLGVTAPVTIAASLDGRIRLDYGQPLNMSIIRKPDAPFDIIGGKTIQRQPHTGAFGELDLLSVFGVLPYLAASKTPAGQTSTANGVIDLYDAQVPGQKVFYRRSLSDRMTVSLDTVTRRVVGIRRTQYAEQDLDHTFTLAHTFSDFRTAGGIVVPFRIDIAVDGVIKETILVDSFQLNPILSADLFER